MFTGIIQAVGTVTSLEDHGDDRRISIRAGELDLANVSRGHSICINGACLTVLDVYDDSFTADISTATLSRTTFSKLKVGDKVNLETALTPSTPLGGHLVSGHVDGVGIVVDRKPIGRSIGFRIQAPASLAKYIAEKGSICVDGVSLTVNAVSGCEFEVNCVPHTLAQTTMTDYEIGQGVNLEVDIIARYLERLLHNEAEVPTSSKITAAFLAEHGFLR